MNFPLDVVYWEIAKLPPELTHIFVKPLHRNNGIGSQLVRLAVERAGEVEIPLTVCSEPGSHDFFLKRGFTDTKFADIDLTKWAPKYSGFGIFRLSGMVILK